MKVMFDGFKIETDERQYIVSMKKVVEASRFTKAENVGKEYWDEIGYCSRLDSAVKIIANKVVLVNDDIEVIKSKLEGIQKVLESLNKTLMQGGN